jgi:gliding motility-associated-like protein
MGKSIQRSALPVLLILFCIAFPLSLSATHQRAAEITYKHLSGLTYEITLISYTYTPSPANAYRDFLTIDWGDGIISQIGRVEIKNLPNDISYNRYYGTHTFPGPATYTISCEDPNRNGGILNIPNSINVPLFIYSELTINPFIGGYNNSPILLLPPIDNACVNQPFYHNPGAYDIDGDSLSYRLVPCRGAQGLEIPGYTLPPATDSLSLNPITGDFVWANPPQQGEYNIAILIEEWRDGVKIGSVLRDMQIIVIACNNHPPVIDPLPDTCVEAGQTLTFPVRAWDPDSNAVTLTATGGPFVVSGNKATMEPNPATGNGHVTATFSWATQCQHVKKAAYPVFFKAKDNSQPVSLANITTMNITVVGPAPENLTTKALGNTITLNWDNYSCQNASGILVFRKADSTGWVHGYCETGVPPYLGYQQIAKISGISNTTYIDDNAGSGLVQGIKYCYLVVAWYADLAEGYASNEACAYLKKDLPVITNVSINTTSTSTGSVYVAWSKPTELDTIQAPGPWKYIVLRSRSDAPQEYVRVDSFATLNDTIYTDTLLNTQDFHFTYAISLINNTPGMRFLVGTSQPASSMFINPVPTDQATILSWNNDVPWNNDTFVIYRRGPGSSVFDSVGFSTVPDFKDTGLVNGDEYCYYIRSIGEYTAPGFVFPIINFSQIACDVPVDNVPPCPPLLRVTTNCDLQQNILSWPLPSDTCPVDIAKYYIYYSPVSTQPPALIDSVLNMFDTTYTHSPQSSVVGCYSISAADSVGNVSQMSNVVCVNYDACVVYKLPNVFTPNNDGTNDLFVPFPKYTSVEKVNMVIVDRWGKTVYKTTDPQINWNGDDMTTGQPCGDGVYFYVCDVYQITLQGIVQVTLKGSVTILH